MANKVTPLTEGSARALKALQAQDGLTLNQLKDAGNEIASAHLTSLVKRGLVSTEKIDIPVTRIQTVNVYYITDAGINYSETEE